MIDNPEAAWTYHEATKHSYSSIRSQPHFLDWSNQPLAFTAAFPARQIQLGVRLTF